jgi:serine/threonine protein kinase
MKELVGKSMDRYRVISLLGEGGMGAVFKGHDVTLQRDVAIKVMHPHIARRPDFQDRFLQEARTAAQLDHPGIVQVYDFGHALDHLYIVMEFIPGANLRTLLKELKASGKWIVLDEALELVRQVSLAVDYAHRHGVLHRDLKPENIMLKTEPSGRLPYRPVLTDLGLAKLVGGGLETLSESSMGTPAYMSPEQAEGRATDSRSDVYSLGILLFELVVGRLPFPARTITEAIRYHTQEPPPSPRSLNPDLPASLERVILKALEKDPANRYQDSKGLALALGEVRSETTAEEVMPTIVEQAVSLIPQLRKSMEKPDQEPHVTPAREIATAMRQDHVVARFPDGQARSAPLEPNDMTLGRSQDNDIILDREGIASHHARITFDGQNYQVTDLNSEGGTFLENIRLLPGVAETWIPGTALRVGDVWLELKRRAAAPSGVIYRPDGTIAEASAIRTSAGEGRVAVFVEAKEVHVEAGGMAKVSAVVLNQGPVVDHFNVSLTGIPAQWLLASPPVRLMPGVQQEVQLAIKPPRSSESRAGKYPVTIVVTSQDDPHQVASVELSVTVAPYYEYMSSLKPQRVRAGKTAQVNIENRGNIQQAFSLAWEDRADELKFVPPRAQLDVPEGKSAAAEFHGKPRRLRWVGGSKTHGFSANVTAQNGETRTLTGEIISRALIPRWLLSLIIAVILVGAAGAALMYFSKIQESTNAQHTLDEAVAATLEHDALVAQAATSTAVWQAADDDRDGISNQDELIVYNTLPDKRDTDEDGLDDGAELAWGTDLLDPDTDKDGIKDGVEVENGWNPINPDTDGDGTPDASDPDPGQVPTLTPSPSPQSTFTPTITATITATPWATFHSILPTLKIPFFYFINTSTPTP